MAIHPIDYRYGTPEMRAVWSEENRFSCIVRAEMALARAGADFGLIPPVAADLIGRNANQASLPRAKEIEAEINHDMMATATDRKSKRICERSPASAFGLTTQAEKVFFQTRSGSRQTGFAAMYPGGQGG